MQGLGIKGLGFGAWGFLESSQKKVSPVWLSRLGAG